MQTVNSGPPVTAPIVAAAVELTVANIAVCAELNAVGTAVPDWRLCHTNVAASDEATLYRLDASTDAVNAPYIVASATAGLRWVAIAGRYQNGNYQANGGIAALTGVIGVDPGGAELLRVGGAARVNGNLDGGAGVANGKVTARALAATSPALALGNDVGDIHWGIYETLGGAGQQGNAGLYDYVAGANAWTVDSFGNLGVRGDVAPRNVPYAWPGANAVGGLTNDGAGNLSWTAAGGAIAAFWAAINNASMISVTAAGALTANRVHYVSGGAPGFDMTLPVGAPVGTVVGIVVAEYSFTSASQYRLDAGVGIPICGRTRYLTLVHTNVALLTVDGAGRWVPLVLSLDTPWIDSGAITITATTTSPTKGPTVRDKRFWRRVGDSLEMRLEYAQSNAGAAGSGDYLYAVPIGAIDTTNKVLAVTAANPAGARSTVGKGSVTDGTYVGNSVCHVYNTSSVRVWSILNNGATTSNGYVYNAGIGNLSAAACAFSMAVCVPMTNW